MARWFLLGCFLGLLCSLTGCSSGAGGPKPIRVKGTVNLDGKPLDDGEVKLFGDDGSVPDVLHVKNGQFEGPAKPGKKRVEIRAYREGPKAKMDKEEVEGSGKENYIPPRFNTNSTRTADVTDAGLSPSNFDVESK